MQQKNDQLNKIAEYFQGRFDEHGTTPRGADWNSQEAQYVRFAQLAKVIQPDAGFSILDYGSGYGAFAEYLHDFGFNFGHYYGVDILPDVVTKARTGFGDNPHITFETDVNDIPQIDYAVASGVFNIRLDASYEDWTAYVIENLCLLHEKTTRGFASNFLTKYSDPDRMVDRLYYADPGYLFDYCKRHFSKNVALLHDYQLYDFTLIVRKF